MIYTNCLRLVETVDFDIRNVSIEVCMQKLQLKTRGCIRMAGHSRNDHPGFGFLRGWPDTPGVFVRVLDFSAADFGKQPKTPSKWPLIKTFNMKVLRLVEIVKIAFGLVSIRGRLIPQTCPARFSQFKPNSFGKFGQNQSEFD